MSGGEAGAARAEILARIARALAGSARDGPDDVAGRDGVVRAYRVAAPELASPADRLARFCARVADYRAQVRRVSGAGAVADAVRACVAESEGDQRYIVPPGLPADRTAGLQADRFVVDQGHAPRSLDTLAGSITGCALAIAETGTIVLDGGAGQGRRAITLVPDHLVVVVCATQVVGTVPEAIRRLAPTMRERAQALTLISGPSATSDIELSRVEGVHGPRRLDVILAEDL